MLTTIAVLVIVLGLMVSLARRVRAQSAEEVTKALLTRLDGLVAEYQARHDRRLPVVSPLIPPNTSVSLLNERTLMRNAEQNSRDLIRALKSDSPSVASAFADLPVSYFDETMVRDAWGSPIVFMPTGDRLLGTALADRYFFFSAGADGHYLSRYDNLYSYEVIGPNDERAGTGP
jgi:hypothetical protein